MTTALRRLVMSATVLALVGFNPGCSSPDNPTLAPAPKVEIPKASEAPKIPGRSQTYGASKKYQDMMPK